MKLSKSHYLKLIRNQTSPDMEQKFLYQKTSYFRLYFSHMGVSLNGGIPNLHPKMIIIFSGKTHGCWGTPPI